MLDVIIIGAGPAGLSAAIECRKNDLNTLVVDEFPKLGGRLLGQLHQEPTGEWWNGIEEAKKLVDEAQRLNTDIRTGISVHHVAKVDDHFVVHTNDGKFEATNVLIATGAAETAVPVPGWTLPGVMSIGAAQVMTNVHRVKVGERGVIVGVNVLSAAIAHELKLGGVDIHSMVLPSKNVISADQAEPYAVMERLSRIAHLAPSAFIRFGSKFAKSPIVQKLAVKLYPKNGITMFDIPIHLRKAIVSINGAEQVESVTIAKVTPEGDIIPNSEEVVNVDFVCIAGGLYPLAELAAVMGCEFKYVEELGGHVPVHSEAMETAVDGLFVAGNITGIESAKVARSQGTVAGLSIAKRMTNDVSLDRQLDRAMQNVKTTRDNATIQFHPHIYRGRERVKAAYNRITETKE